jgi:hypothetical protein
MDGVTSVLSDGLGLNIGRPLSITSCQWLWFIIFICIAVMIFLKLISMRL